MRTIAWVIRLLSGRGSLHLRLASAQLLSRLIPCGVLRRHRWRLYRMAGIRAIGSDVILLGTLELSGEGALTTQLSIGHGTWINQGCSVEVNAPVRIGANVGIGPHVLILTSTHEFGPAERRVGRLVRLPVAIDEGAWIGARSTILPGVHVGRGAVVSAGTVVFRDVPPNAIVAGNPARVVGWLDVNGDRLQHERQPHSSVA